ncbi:MAG: cytochrome c [Sediminimonas qiaohouensis]|uniref:Cytochrome c n=1 Tax=Sediminimonas qiaohouensis TaxID=552061 RepID=A0A7C9HBE0_9RHOB|nr:cytochrome c [Sediminimonas qiaohouensis]MTJ05146.1 cytochrome c [Sediminimonas qiaohouensis]
MRFLKTLSKVSVAFALTALGTLSSADETGKVEYMQNCATCHGESGLGQGPLAELMTVSVPGLTGLSARNDGVFPMLEVIHIIDGRQGTRGHGGPMPVWGGRFKASVEEMGPYSAEMVVRGRVLSLVYYLESIQQ